MRLKTLFILLCFFSLFSSNIEGQTATESLSHKNYPIIKDSIPVFYELYVPFKKAYEAFSNSNYEKAIKYYNSYLDTDPNEHNAIFNRGICYYKMHEFSRCCNDFKFAAYLGNPSALNNYKSFWCAEKIKTTKFEYQLKHGIIPSVAFLGLEF